jgi:hypothetical protein
VLSLTVSTAVLLRGWVILFHDAEEVDVGSNILFIGIRIGVLECG